MPEEQTCGKGLAENSALPSSLAEVVAATARVLEVHMKALDPTDENGKRELAAYRELASTHRRIAAELAALAERMAGYRDLPMAPHDMAVMTSPAPRHAFAGLVQQEERLAELLRSRLARHQAMLAQMGA
jgi:phytoene dehydrogenase-like protein